MREKVKFFLLVQFQPISVERNMELENHHLSTIVTDLGKHHQWILKLVGESMRRNSIFTVSRDLTMRYTLTTKGKTGTFCEGI